MFPREPHCQFLHTVEAPFNRVLGLGRNLKRVGKQEPGAVGHIGHRHKLKGFNRLVHRKLCQPRRGRDCQLKGRGGNGSNGEEENTHTQRVCSTIETFLRFG